MNSIITLIACSFIATCGAFADSVIVPQEILSDETEIFSCSRCKSVFQGYEENKVAKCNCGGKVQNLFADCGCKGKTKKDPVAPTPAPDQLT